MKDRSTMGTSVSKGSYAVISSDRDTKLILDSTLPAVRYDGDRYYALDRFREEVGGRHLTHCSSADMGSDFCSVSSHGLVGACIMAYNYHRPLVLRPDDFLLLLAIEASKAITDDPERYRGRCVSHWGKKELEVVQEGEIFDAETFIMEMRALLERNVSEPLLSILTPNFTTTTKYDRLVTNAVMMCVYQSYFDYSCSMSCGLPSVTLKGLYSDWVELRDRYRQYKILLPELEDWYKGMDGVIDLMVRTVALRFDGESIARIAAKWGEMCKVTIGDEGYYPTEEFDGWVKALDRKTCGFSGRVPLDSFSSTVVQCPFTLKAGEITRRGVLYAGQVGVRERIGGDEGEEEAVGVETGWAMAVENDDNAA